MRMSMPMVQVGIMGVPMHQRRMPVPMAMRLAVRDTGRVFMLVVVVMNVAMGMLQRLVCVLVGVRFGKMQPEPDRHQYTGKKESYRNRLPEQRDCQQRAHERRHREICARARRAEMPQGEHEQHQADAIAEKADARRDAKEGRGRKRRAKPPRNNTSEG